MSVVVAIKDKNSIIMGADSILVGESLKISLSEYTPKVFVKKNILIGGVETVRVIQGMWKIFEPPLHKKGVPAIDYLVKDFATAFQKCLKNIRNEESSTSMGAQFLIGYNGVLVVFDEDFSITEHRLPYNAIGAGEEYAFGSFFSTEGKPARKRVETALAAAEEFCPKVKGPFVIKKIEYEVDQD